MKNTFVFLFFSFIGLSGFSQGKKTPRDSTKKDSTVHYQHVQDTIARDSTDLYQKIKKESDKSKFTKKLADLIFKDTDTSSHDNKYSEEQDFAEFEDKIIREIRVETKKPFGYSLTDTTKTPHSWVQKTGNAVHAKTKHSAIKKFLLFKEGNVLDTFEVQETARLLREQRYIRRVRIVPKAVDNASDSLDLEVQILDSWSLLPKGRISGSSFKVGLQERNFIGWGHQVDMNYSRRYSNGNNGFESIYTIPNINNSFIDFTGQYAVDLDRFYDKFLSINREFYSPLTRWAGGAFLQERFLKRPMPDKDQEFKEQSIKFIYQNYWGGYAIHLFDKDDSERTKNLNLSLRTMLLNYKENPSEEYDSDRYFSNERFFLGSIGFTDRRFVTDRYIFKDGETEDIPVGSVYSVTSGVQRKHDASRFYLGLRTTYGDYFDWGFLSGHFEMGSFFNRGHSEQTTFSFKGNYFSRLMDIGGNWKMRQFIKPQLVIGINRKNAVGDRLGLNDRSYYNGVNSYEYLDYLNKSRYIEYKNGSIRGFDSSASGTRKYVLDVQSQFYSPWNVVGFRLNPFLDVSLGLLTGSEKSYYSNKLYSSFTLGFIIRNDYFVFDSFQVSMSFYPSMPGEDGSNFRTNSFKNEDYGFQDFTFDEPRPVIYE